MRSMNELCNLSSNLGFRQNNIFVSRPWVLKLYLATRLATRRRRPAAPSGLGGLKSRCGWDNVTTIISSSSLNPSSVYRQPHGARQLHCGQALQQPHPHCMAVCILSIILRTQRKPTYSGKTMGFANNYMCDNFRICDNFYSWLPSELQLSPNYSTVTKFAFSLGNILKNTTHLAYLLKPLPVTRKMDSGNKYPLCLSLGRVGPPFYWNIFVGTQPHFSIESKVHEKRNMPPSLKPIKRVPKLTQAKPQDSSQNKPQRGSSPVPWTTLVTDCYQLLFVFWILLRIVVVGICTRVSTLRVWSHYIEFICSNYHFLYFLWETHKNRHVSHLQL